MNYSLFHAINQMAGHHPIIDGIMKFFTNYALVLFAVLLVVMWVTGNERNKRTVLYAGLSGILALVINVIISQIYKEPRPFVTHHVNLLLPHAADSGFPSDHTSGAFGIAIAMLMRNTRMGRWMIAIAIVTGFSRIYVGHHYPGDVLGSIVVACISSFLILRFKQLLEPLVQAVISIYHKIIPNKPTVKKQAP
ncbi:undecaprenyl-diphosphatase [Aneurinibacillus sp. Ricciae_BoGa-3]|uniref:undecaprenyl-diphosphatase n=1 Tax=Aneurinibacillus sp. Ricciae_BoGa-3 TaxID=3022697 RepID=UPI002340F0E4|nr:undecaprenyl-diphosphatase [Aneurinibacillus sp. Ricciae_BoGa-3]WCK52548.1 undecaprenyl-diphosphatase [Aneurinibacillus sp. Ricciae_BoGa-3]